jgi:hypothetical protein
VLLLDEYERKARLLPGLLACLPIAVAVIALGLHEQPVVSILTSLFATMGGGYVLATVARQLGQGLEQRMFEKWGRPPTTNLLRLTGSRPNDADRERRRARLADLIHVRFPSLEEEAKAPDAADTAYASAVARLRELTRQPDRFPLVFAENCAYGFTRNMLALRPLGLSLAVLAGALLVLLLLSEATLSQPQVPAVSLGAGLALNTLLAVFWFFYPTEERVRLAAKIYAERLLDSTEVLYSQTPPVSTGQGQSNS